MKGCKIIKINLLTKAIHRIYQTKLDSFSYFFSIAILKIEVKPRVISLNINFLSQELQNKTE